MSRPLSDDTDLCLTQLDLLLGVPSYLPTYLAFARGTASNQPNARRKRPDGPPLKVRTARGTYMDIDTVSNHQDGCNRTSRLAIAAATSSARTPDQKPIGSVMERSAAQFCRWLVELQNVFPASFSGKCLHGRMGVSRAIDKTTRRIG